MAGIKKYGRGTGFYFSEDDLKKLEEAIDLLTKYGNAQERMAKATGKEWNKLYDTAERYEKQLKAINYSTTDDIKLLQTRLDYMRQIYDQEIQAESSKKRSQENEKAYQRELDRFRRLTVDDTREHINQQERLYKLQHRAAREMADETKSVKEKEESTQRYIKLYDKLNNRIKESRRNEKIADARRDFVENGVGSIFGVNSSTIKEVKDGTYKWKLLTDVFKKAVDLFSASVKQSIDANYNTTEAILNGMTASNNMSWNSGEFKLNGRAYQGFSNINNAIKDQLKEEGLYDNIAIKDVMEAANKITVQEGLNASDALTKGLQDTVIKYIVPYLDTSSEAFTNLEYLMPRNIKKYCINCN